MQVDWSVVILAFLAAIPPSLVALAALVQAIRTHKAVNSRMTELLEVTKRAAAGDAVAEERKEVAAAAAAPSQGAPHAT